MEEKETRPEDHSKLQTSAKAETKDSDLMAAAIQAVTSQPTPEAQAEMAESLAQQMSEEQKQELMSQLAGDTATVVTSAPAMAAPEPTQAAALPSDADLAAAIAAEQPDASPADIAAAVAAMKTEMKGGATPAAPAAPEQAPVTAVATPPPAPAA